MKKTAILALLLAGMWGAGVSAQPAQKLVTVVVSPDRTDWQCKAKEEVTFNVQVFKHENLLEGVTVDYELGPECFPTVTKQDVVLPTGKTTLKASMKEPGFLRCKVTAKVDGRRYEGMAPWGWTWTAYSPPRPTRRTLTLFGPKPSPRRARCRSNRA